MQTDDKPRLIAVALHVVPVQKLNALVSVVGGFGRLPVARANLLPVLRGVRPLLSLARSLTRHLFNSMLNLSAEVEL